MKKTTKPRIAVVWAVLLVIAMSGCSKNSGNPSVSPAVSAASAEKAESTEKIKVTYQEEDLNSSWQDGKYTSITESSNSIVIEGNGARESNGIVTITTAGTYVFSGSFSQIAVDAGKNDVVQIVLNNASVICKNSSAINGVQSEKVILTLSDGTKNQLEDGSKYENLDSSDEPNAAFFSKDDIVINGTGTLTVKGNYNHGIACKDDLTVISGNLIVTAVNDGIKGKDSIVVRDGTIDIVSGGDAMQSSNDTDTSKGYIVLEGGIYTIDASKDGIQAETILQISGGQYEINAGESSTSADAKANSAKSDNMRDRGKMGEFPGGTVPDDMLPSDTAEATPMSAVTENSADTAADSQKALKGGSAVYIMDGKITVDSFEDSVHSNGNVSISGGTLTLNSGDDAIHADADLLIEGGTIMIPRSYEGLEGNTVAITDGSIHLKASDDGVNASGGSSSFGGASSGSDGSANTDTYIRITGGYLYMEADGDGLDSNGMLSIDGGITIVNGSASGGNGALDYDGTAQITGGTLIAAGSSQMAQTMSDSSTQPSLFVSYQSTQAAGTLVNLLDENGDTVFCFAPAKAYSSIVISSPSLVSEKTYTLTSGGSVTDSTQSPADGYYLDGNNVTGTKLTEVTLTDIATKIADDGTAVTINGMGGGMGRRGEGGMGKMDGSKPQRNE